MSASTMTSAVSVLALDIERSLLRPHLHIPHMAERRAGEKRLVSKPRFLRREAVVSLDTSRAPAMLHRVGMRLFAGESQQCLVQP